MKKIVMFMLVLGFYSTAKAQIVEVNPSVNWKYVRSQKLELQDESVYQYEFPAEKGFDYIFNLFYSEENIITFIHVYDMQMKPIATLEDENARKTTKLSFSVPASGTYIVVVGYKDKTKASPTANIELTLIRREFVE
mgnify:FL=1